MYASQEEIARFHHESQGIILYEDMQFCLAKEQLEQRGVCLPFGEELYYDDYGKKLDEAWWERLKENCNGAELAAEAYACFAIITTDCEIRLAPTSCGCYRTREIGKIDRFAHSMLKIGTAVLVWHISLDRKWYMVQWEKGWGWVAQRDIAFADRLLWKDWHRSAFVQRITGKSGRKEKGCFEGRNWKVGTKLPLEKEHWLEYEVLVPLRKENGKVEIRKQTVRKNEGFYRGYLPCRSKMILALAMSMLGQRYAWGGKGLYQDCTSFIGDVYEMCGVKLPRNSEDMLRMPLVQQILRDELEQMLERLHEGAILLFPGHAMLWLGEKKKKHLILHNVYALGEKTENGVQEKMLEQVCVGSLEQLRTNGVSLWESVTACWDIFL